MKTKHYIFQSHTIHRIPPLKTSFIHIYHCDSVTDNISDYPMNSKIIFACEGSGFISIGKQRFPLNKNDLFIMNPDDSLITIEPSDQDYYPELIMIGFNNTEFLFPSKSTDAPYIHFTLDKEKDSLYFEWIRKELSSKSPGFQNACDYYVNLLLIELLRDFNIKYTIINKEKSNHDCEKVRNYINDHYSENITLDILAKHSKMNKYYMVHSFTNYYGCSPISYLNEKKIHESKILLRTSDYSIAEIADQIGFSSQSYFSQSFKKHTHMTPNEYRHSSNHVQ